MSNGSKLVNSQVYSFSEASVHVEQDGEAEGVSWLVHVPSQSEEESLLIFSKWRSP